MWRGSIHLLQFATSWRCSGVDVASDMVGKTVSAQPHLLQLSQLLARVLQLVLSSCVTADACRRRKGKSKWVWTDFLQIDTWVGNGHSRKARGLGVYAVTGCMWLIFCSEEAVMRMWWYINILCCLKLQARTTCFSGAYDTQIRFWCVRGTGWLMFKEYILL